jgi:hypothetical protein
MAKREVEIFDILATRELEKPIFNSGAVSTILNIKPWALYAFCKTVGVKPSGRPPRGASRRKRRGGRTWFNLTDLYLLRIARRSMKDGFNAEFARNVLQRIDREELETYGPYGDVVRQGYITVRRTEDGYDVSRPQMSEPSLSLVGPVYYAIDIDAAVRWVDEKVRVVRSKSQQPPITQRRNHRG